MTDNRCQNLLLNMEQLRQKQSLTDVVLECKDGLVHAHKSILISSCTYFQTMFTVNMEEKKTGIVKFPTQSKDVVETIIKYLYTSRIPELPDDAAFERELIQMSHMMELHSLIDAFLEQKTKTLTAQNFADLWTTATDFDCHKRKPLQNFLENSLEIVCQEKSVQKLAYDHVTKLMECIDPERSCKESIRIILGWKSGGDGREEIAAQEMRKIDMRHLDDPSLFFLMRYDIRNLREETAENIVVREAVNRMISNFGRSVNVCDNCDVECDNVRYCIDTHGEVVRRPCQAEIQLQEIKQFLNYERSHLPT